MSDRSIRERSTEPGHLEEKVEATGHVDRVELSVEQKTTGHRDYHGIDTTHVQPGADAAYEAKIALVNEALIDIGMGPFQWKLFILTGFGWFVDNVWLQAITIVGPAIQREFAVKRIAFLTVAKYVGLTIGASTWPLAADFIGRRPAFNISLLCSSLSALVAAGSPNFVAMATLCALIGVGAGGNHAVDSAIFLEYIPATHQHLLTVQSVFLATGIAVAALVSWPLVVNFTCPAGTPQSECGFHENIGWRYIYWTLGGFTLFLSFCRFMFGLYETPKYLLGRGKDEAAVKVITKMAARDGKTTWLTLAHLQAVDARLEAAALLADDRDSQSGGAGLHATANQTTIQRFMAKWAPSKVRALFSTPRMALSTSMMIVLWTAIGMSYPLYNSFIPFYLERKGVAVGASSLDITYRNYTIQAVCGLPAAILGGFSVRLKNVGRKGTGAFACICTGLFLFLYTQASNSAAVLGFSCAISFFQFLMYGLLYSYTPELFPAPIRGTGNGLMMTFNRLAGVMAPLIAAYVGIETDTPIWLCASLLTLAGFMCLLLPYESRGRAAS
ncbi:hypothetical protein Z517_06816 [Fonsecaea pedrosoi CBS 271.37]|uniref:Major facilitator superfamily (MFS) profile domain-containing protein n=1 Tax=Fonsecaea pedrosoi CBS 271.37 TaxID=1442368 RepID=A0A0D2DQU9_9EURO|nr:uncharacterized protein Z517_06816 [Fonsecaea pedrosoi CBS 271.37]KIW80201.1 hypothetical protein Z517_06816 [Fonsecaea pedrosoi CBS 271.37]